MAAPLRGDLVQHHRGLGDAAAAAAVLLGDRDADPAALGHAGVEVPRELVLAVAPRPVVVVEPGAEVTDRVGDETPGPPRGGRSECSCPAVWHPDPERPRVEARSPDQVVILVP